MTEVGQIALKFGERVESEMQAFGREILGRDLRIYGRIRLTARSFLSDNILP